MCYISQCLKITQNVAFEFFNVAIFHQLLSQGRPPRNSEKGAVRYGLANVASETTLTLGQKLPRFLLLF